MTASVAYEVKSATLTIYYALAAGAMAFGGLAGFVGAQIQMMF